jgi:hypothetical protein
MSTFLLLSYICGYVYVVALSLTRGRVSHIQIFVVLDSAVNFGSQSHVVSDHILLSLIRGFPFRRLLRYAGLNWRYSTAPPLESLVH